MFGFFPPRRNRGTGEATCTRCPPTSAAPSWGAPAWRSTSASRSRARLLRRVGAASAGWTPPSGDRRPLLLLYPLFFGLGQRRDKKYGGFGGQRRKFEKPKLKVCVVLRGPGCPFGFSFETHNKCVMVCLCVVCLGCTPPKWWRVSCGFSLKPTHRGYPRKRLTCPHSQKPMWFCICLMTPRWAAVAHIALESKGL